MISFKQKLNLKTVLKTAIALFSISLVFFTFTNEANAYNNYVTKDKNTHGFKINFSNEFLTLSLDKSQDTGENAQSFAADTLLATEIFDYLSSNSERHEIQRLYESLPNGIEIVSSVFTENTKKIINSYQSAQKLQEDGIIGVQTAFDMGYQIALINRDSDEDSCKSTNAIFIASEKIEDVENDKNYQHLKNVLTCLNLINNNNKKKLISGLYTIDIYPNNVIKKVDTNVYSLGIAGMFDLGRRFGLAGGKIDYDSQLSKNNDGKQDYKKDPCKRLDKYGLNVNPNMNFGGEIFNLVPDSPGTLDWRSLEIEEFLGGSRNNDDTINRDKNCIAGTSILVAIVWKVLLFFEGLLAIIAVAMFLYGGYLYLTSGGEEKMTEKAKKSLLWSVIGVVIVISSRLISTILMPRYKDSVFIDTDKLLTAESADPGFESIIGITNFVLGFVASLAIIMIIYGGYLFMVPTGDENMQQKGKTILVQAIIGLVIVILAYTLVATIFGATGQI